MVVYMTDKGYMTAFCKGLNGTVSRESSGWVWNVYDEDQSRLRSITFGSQEQQWAAYGELLSKMFELTT